MTCSLEFLSGTDSSPPPQCDRHSDSCFSLNLVSRCRHSLSYLLRACLSGFLSPLDGSVCPRSYNWIPRVRAAAAAKSHQSFLTLCDPIDGSPPGSHPWDSPGKNTGVGCHFLLQCMKVKSESEVAQSCPSLETPWTVAYQAPPSMGFPRQEYWSGLPLPSLRVRAKSLLSCPTLCNLAL